MEALVRDPDSEAGWTVRRLAQPENWALKDLAWLNHLVFTVDLQDPRNLRFDQHVVVTKEEGHIFWRYIGYLTYKSAFTAIIN